MNRVVENLYRRFRRAEYGGIGGESARGCLDAARTLVAWEALEEGEQVRLRCEPEQENYFDVYGEPDDARDKQAIIDAIERDGCWWIVAEYRCPCCGQWEHADSIGMCIYSNPLNPFENCYVVDLMAAAIEQLHDRAAVSA